MNSNDVHAHPNRRRRFISQLHVQQIYIIFKINKKPTISYL